MDYLEIEGGSPLCGEVRIQGSKNAVLPILCAALESPGVTVLENCPDISDVGAMLEILKGYGCRARREGSRLVLDAGSLHSGRAPEDYAGMMRSSIMLLGSLLARLGEAFLPYPGGCVIGKGPSTSICRPCGSWGRSLRRSRKACGRSAPTRAAPGSVCPFQAWGRQKMSSCWRRGRKELRCFRTRPGSQRSWSSAGS